MGAAPQGPFHYYTPESLLKLRNSVNFEAQEARLLVLKGSLLSLPSTARCSGVIQQ